MSATDRDRGLQRAEQVLEWYARATEVDATPELRGRVLVALDRAAAGAAPSIHDRLGDVRNALGSIFATRRIRAVGLAMALLALVGAGLVLAGAAGQLQLPWNAPRASPSPTEEPALVPPTTPEPTSEVEPPEEARETEAPDEDATETEPAETDNADESDDAPSPEATDGDGDESAAPADDPHDDGSGGDSIGEDASQE